MKIWLLCQTQTENCRSNGCPLKPYLLKNLRCTETCEYTFIFTFIISFLKCITVLVGSCKILLVWPKSKFAMNVLIDFPCLLTTLKLCILILAGHMLSTCLKLLQWVSFLDDLIFPKKALNICTRNQTQIFKDR